MGKTTEQRAAGAGKGGAAEGPPPLEKVKYPMRFSVLRAVRVERASPTVMRVVCAPDDEAGGGAAGGRRIVGADGAGANADAGAGAAAADAARPAGRGPIESRGLVGEYVRVVIPPAETGVLPEPEYKGEKPVWPKPSPPSRKYTIRRYDPGSGELEINVVLHEHGLGAEWAQGLQPGDPVYVLGPKSGYRISEDYDFYLLAGDETGLPGMARWLEAMPRGARGRAVIEVSSPDSRQGIDAPDGVAVEWVTREGTVSRLAETVMAGGVPEGEVFMWLAGESGAIRPLRAWMRQELGLAKGHGYSSGYWKLKEKK